MGTDPSAIPGVRSKLRGGFAPFLPLQQLAYNTNAINPGGLGAEPPLTTTLSLGQFHSFK